jgi:hypothetical protein
MSSFARSPVARFGVLAVLVVLGLFQAFWHLGRANINPDEGIYLTAGREYIRGIFTFNREHPPTAKYIYGLAQEFLGPSLTSGRIAAAGIAFVAGFVILVWLRKELGWWWAVLATGFWWLLPRAVVDTGVKIDRFAILEPFMVSFAILAMALGWWWFRRPHWWNAALAGAAMALSVTSKVSTAFLVLTFLYLAVRVLIQDHRVVRFLIGLASYAVAFAAVTIASWQPMGMISAIKYMIAFQAGQKIGGHNVIVEGHTVTHPPWWANLWFTEQGLGFWLTLALCVAGVFAFLPRPSELSVYLGVAGVVLVIFYCGIAGNALPSYYYVWVWILFVLAVIGLRALWGLRWQRDGRRRAAVARHGAGSGSASERSARWVLRPVAAVILVIALVSAGSTTAAIAEVSRTGFGRAEPVLEAHGITRLDILATGYASWEYTPYLRSSVKGSVVTNNHAAFVPTTYTGTVVALRTDDRIVYDRPLAHFVEANRSRFTHVVVDDVDFYLPRGGATVVQTGETFSFGAAVGG